MIQNPILKGFNPDPSICRVGLDYYIATSTFDDGIPVSRSTVRATSRPGSSSPGC